MVEIRSKNGPEKTVKNGRHISRLRKTKKKEKEKAKESNMRCEHLKLFLQIQRLRNRIIPAYRETHRE